MSRCLSILILLYAFSFTPSFAQDLQPVHSHTYPRYLQPDNAFTAWPDTVSADNEEEVSYPDPKSVMYKSLIIPGWGQVINRQIWKVPLVYGLLGGLAWYSIRLTKQYHGYRAAYYNINPQAPDDMRYGPTPAYIPENANLESLRHNRNALRNRRDMAYIFIGLAYGLNAIDAYVFAHMRSFDVSEDLSMKPTIKPSVMDRGALGLTLSVELFNKSKAR